MQVQAGLKSSPTMGLVTSSRIDPEELKPIDEVARQLGMRASAIRYYEERGLIEPSARRSGRRWYGPDAIRRLAIIRFWQTSGLMSLDEIAVLLTGAGACRSWSQLMRNRIDTLAAQIEQMQDAKTFLEHVLFEHADASPDGCSHYEALIFGLEPGHDHLKGPSHH